MYFHHYCTLYNTNDCVSHCNSVQIFKFADDTTLIGLITNDTNRTIEGRFLHCLIGVALII